MRRRNTTTKVLALCALVAALAVATTTIAQPGSSATASKPRPSGGTGLPAVGPRKALVILANFTDLRTQTPSPDAVRSQVFGQQAPSLAHYYGEVSFGKATFEGLKNPAGDVFGWVTLNARSTTCDWPNWGKLARQAAQKAGYAVDSYTHVLHFFARTPCEFGASGLKGGRYSWYNGEMTTATIIHEVGHNIGMDHANGAWCAGADGVRLALGGTCVSKEYGDEFDIMGIGYIGHVNNFYKGRLGWLSGENTQTVSAGGTYSVAPIETASHGAQALRIPRGDGTYLYVEYRRPVGYDQYAPTSPVEYDGAVIRIAPDYGIDAEPQLVDTTPFTNTIACFNCVADQTLKVERGLFDPVSRVYLKTVSADDAALVVSVMFNYQDASPLADAGVGTPHVRGIRYEHTGASATDVDADLNAYRWEFISCPGTCPALTRATGGLVGDSAEIPGPSFTPMEPGTYRLMLTVWDGAGGTATAAVDVIVL